MAQDHPHACGDKLYEQRGKVASSGSSPRVWGQVFRDLKRSGLERIIPTRVGTSGVNIVGAGEVEDHPHACGDKLYRAALMH